MTNQKIILVAICVFIVFQILNYLWYRKRERQIKYNFETRRLVMLNIPSDEFSEVQLKYVYADGRTVKTWYDYNSARYLLRGHKGLENYEIVGLR